MSNIAYYNFNQMPPSLHHFQDTVCAKVTLRAGKYVLFAKAQLQNFDGDYQNADARLTAHQGSVQLDQVTVRLGGGGGSFMGAVALLGTWTVQDDDVIEVRCATYNGNAVWVYLVAMLVDEILTGP